MIQLVSCPLFEKMSLFSAQINFDRPQFDNNLLDSVSLVIAKAFNQDVEDIRGNLIKNCHLLWNGTTEPAISVVVQSVQSLNREQNCSCAKALSKCLSQASGVPENRIFINFVEKVLSDVAVNGSLLWQSAHEI